MRMLSKPGPGQLPNFLESLKPQEPAPKSQSVLIPNLWRNPQSAHALTHERGSERSEVRFAIPA
eukprot:4586057-Lingulodinium_polyedra.AAC.1